MIGSTPNALSCRIDARSVSRVRTAARDAVVAAVGQAVLVVELVITAIAATFRNEAVESEREMAPKVGPPPVLAGHRDSQRAGETRRKRTLLPR